MAIKKSLFAIQKSVKFMFPSIVTEILFLKQRFMQEQKASNGYERLEDIYRWPSLSGWSV